MGNPLGLTGTVTDGIVSATGRTTVTVTLGTLTS
jgi:S1-C subfamily serine protease